MFKYNMNQAKFGAGCVSDV